MAIFNKTLKAGGQINDAKAEKIADLSSGPGPYMAVVESNADYTKHGSLSVSILGNQDSLRSVTSGRISCRVMLPFYSVKDYANAGKDPQKFEDTQQSYGMVFPAPQVGTKGLVIFINKNIEQAVWIGALAEPEMNHQIPDYAAKTDISTDDDTYNELSPGPDGLPVSNYNKAAFIGQTGDNKIKHPVHPIAYTLKEQGLLADKIRGLTSSSHRRDAVNHVFGINTPGRYVGKERLVGAEQAKVKVTQPGGHVFVMDDGDSLGDNNLIRLRTKGGHQILLHDTDDLIYIGNSKGTAWIELTSDGKMDVFCDDSISMRTRGDFNLYADRDFNVEAKRNINMKAFNYVKQESNHHRQIVNGSQRIMVKGNSDIKTLNSRLDTNDYQVNTNNLSIANRIDTKIQSGNFDLATTLGIRQTAGTSVNIKANSSTAITETFVATDVYSKGYTTTFINEDDELKFYQALKRTQDPDTLEAIDPNNTEYWTEFAGPEHKAGASNGQINISTTQNDISIDTSGANINVETDKIVYVDGTEAVHLNLPGPGAKPNISAYNSAPQPSRLIDHMGVIQLWEKEITAKWEGYNYYRSDTFETILKRVPTHEPWDQHENQNPNSSKKSVTDREA